MQQPTKKTKTGHKALILRRLQDREQTIESKPLTSMPVVEINTIPLKHKKIVRVTNDQIDKTSTTNIVSIDQQLEKSHHPILNICAYDLLEPKTSIEDVNVVEFTIKQMENGETVKKQINVRFDRVYGLIIDCEGILLMFGVIGKGLEKILTLIKAINHPVLHPYGYSTVESFFVVLQVFVNVKWVNPNGRIDLIIQNEIQLKSAFAKLSELYNFDLTRRKSEARYRVFTFFSEVQEKLKKQHMIDDMKLCDDSTSSFANLSYHIDKVLSKK
jgi:hypothetical protein